MSGQEHEGEDVNVLEMISRPYREKEKAKKEIEGIFSTENNQIPRGGIVLPPRPTHTAAEEAAAEDAEIQKSGGSTDSAEERQQPRHLAESGEEESHDHEVKGGAEDIFSNPSAEDDKIVYQEQEKEIHRRPPGHWACICGDSDDNTGPYCAACGGYWEDNLARIVPDTREEKPMKEEAAAPEPAASPLARIGFWVGLAALILLACALVLRT